MKTVSIDDISECWNQMAAERPFEAILTGLGTGPEASERLFASGRKKLDEVFDYLRPLGLLDPEAMRGAEALDFGCGAGRLTNALSEHFRSVTGVDASSGMLALARRFRTAENVDLVLNEVPSLSSFESGRFRFVISLLVLHHLTPELAQRYLRELFRVLAEGGVAVVQVPHGPDWSLVGVWTRLRLLLPGPAESVLRSVLRQHRGLLFTGVPESRVLEIASESGVSVEMIHRNAPRGWYDRLYVFKKG